MKQQANKPQIRFGVRIMPLWLMLWMACSEPANRGPAVQLTGEFPVCATMDTVRVYRVDGFMPEVVLAAPVTSGDGAARFVLEGPLPDEGLYLVGKVPNNVMPLILGREQGLRLSGNCSDLRRFGRVENSPLNAAYQSLGQTFAMLQQQQQGIAQQRLRATQTGDEALMAQTQAGLEALHQRRRALLDSLGQAAPLLARLFAPQVWAPYDWTSETSELVHFARSYLADVDLADPVYAYNPVIPEHVSLYARTLYQGGMAQEEAEAYLDSLLARIPATSRLHKNALASLVQVLDQLRSTSFLKYAAAYRTQYPPLPAQVSTFFDSREATYREAAAAEQRLGIGAEAPPIELPTPTGGTFALRNLLGKVVLIDFLASWCKPCRVENPRVVKLYQQYKNQGFDILGVSLDGDRAAWVAAIEQDGLAWHHVSDLRRWQCQAAQDYRVSSIPATYLLDREGRIIAKNLRGPALEARLAQLFAP